MLICILPCLIGAETTAEQQAHSRSEKIAAFLEAKNLSPEAIVFVTAMLPIVELRGSIPLGINVLGLSPWKTVGLSLLGNFLPLVLILLLFDPVQKILSKIPLFARFFTWLFQRTRSKSGVIQRYEEIGLIFFVAIPLPITGGWTGSLAAYLFGLKYGISLLCLALGIVFAAAIVTTLSLLGQLGGWIAIVAVTVLLVVSLFKKRKVARQV